MSDNDEQARSDNSFYSAQLMKRAATALSLDPENTSWFEVVGTTEAAASTLKALGYTYNGGQLWRPPLGKKPDFSLIDRLNATIARQCEELARYQQGHTNLIAKLEAAEQRNRELVAGIVALPLEFRSLSGSENTAGVHACIDYISDWVAEVAKPATEVPKP